MIELRTRRVMSVAAVKAVAILVLLVASAFAQTSNPPAIGIFLDNSGTMFSQIPRERGIANAIVKARPGSPVSLFGFAAAAADKPSGIRFATGAQCETQRDTIRSQIEGIAVARPGQTILIDAIQSAVQAMHNPALSACRDKDERILVVITDGEDRASVARPADLIDFVKARKVKLYIIGLIGDMSKQSGFLTHSPAERSKDFLLKLAKATGGRVVFPKDKDTAEAIVEGLFSEKYVFPK